MNKSLVKNVATELRSIGAKDNGSTALAAAIAYSLPVLPVGTAFKFVFRQQYEGSVASLISAVNEIQVVDYQATLELTESLYVSRMQALYSPLVKCAAEFDVECVGTNYATIQAFITDLLK